VKWTDTAKIYKSKTRQNRRTIRGRERLVGFGLRFSKRGWAATKGTGTSLKNGSKPSLMIHRSVPNGISKPILMWKQLKTLTNKKLQP